MTSVALIDPRELVQLLSMAEAIDALERLFSEPLPDAPPRTCVRTGVGDLLLMPATGPQGAGAKVVTVAPANPGRGLPLVHGFYALFDPHTLVAEAVIDGAALTALRTPAASGLATRHLAPHGARRLVLFGAGAQAVGHLDAMLAVRSIEQVTVVSRSPASADRLAAVARYRGLGATVGTADAVADADIVCTCTTSREPVFDGTLLRPGTHVNAVGSYRSDARELDEAAMTAATVVVETRAAALEEAGDVVIPLRAGRLEADSLVELAAVIAGAEGRRSPTDVTVFKSVGLAVEDLAVARAAVDRLRSGGG